MEDSGESSNRRRSGDPVRVQERARKGDAWRGSDRPHSRLPVRGCAIGKVLQAVQLRPTAPDCGLHAVAPDADGGTVAAGYYYSTSEDPGDGLFLRVPRSGKPADSCAESFFDFKVKTTATHSTATASSLQVSQSDRPVIKRHTPFHTGELTVSNLCGAVLEKEIN